MSEEAPLNLAGNEGVEDSYVSALKAAGWNCHFCGLPVVRDEPTTYLEATSWVTGPKLDHPKLRMRTGRKAHGACVERAVAGQAPDQPTMDL
jgi:hypothetical protein